MANGRSVAGVSFFVSGTCFFIAAMLNEENRVTYIGVGVAQLGVGASMLATSSSSKPTSEDADEPGSDTNAPEG